MQKNQADMRISTLGEFGLIEYFRKRIRNDYSVVMGSGDDCAVLRLDKQRYLLFTCDMIVENVDFKRKHKPQLIGRKALSVSISDIAACGGVPRHAVVSLGLPKNLPLSFVKKLFSGLNSVARQYKVNLVGGDISRAKALTIDVSMLGFVEKSNLVLRSGAKIGDIVIVTGPLGGSIKGRHLEFVPRIKEARFLVENFKIHSMIDISDGLAADLSHIFAASRAGAVIYESLIPVHAQARNLQDAIFSGEDFELLFTVSFQEAKRIAAARKFKFYPIGEIVSKNLGFHLIDAHGRQRELSPEGFRHF